MWSCQNWVKLIAESFQVFAFSRLSIWSFVQDLQGEPWPGTKLRAPAVLRSEHCLCGCDCSWVCWWRLQKGNEKKIPPSLGRSQYLGAPTKRKVICRAKEFMKIHTENPTQLFPVLPGAALLLITRSRSGTRVGKGHWLSRLGLGLFEVLKDYLISLLGKRVCLTCCLKSSKNTKQKVWFGFLDCKTR